MSSGCGHRTPPPCFPGWRIKGTTGLLPCYQRHRQGLAPTTSQRRALNKASRIIPQVGTQFRLDVANRRQFRFERRRHFAQQLVLGDPHRLGDTPQGIFGNQPVLFLAEQQTNGRLILRCLTWASMADR